MLSSLHVPPFSQEGEHVTDDEKEQEAIDKTHLTFTGLDAYAYVHT